MTKNSDYIDTAPAVSSIRVIARRINTGLSLAFVAFGVLLYKVISKLNILYGQMYSDWESYELPLAKIFQVPVIIWPLVIGGLGIGSLLLGIRISSNRLWCLNVVVGATLMLVVLFFVFVFLSFTFPQDRLIH